MRLAVGEYIAGTIHYAIIVTVLHSKYAGIIGQSLLLRTLWK